MKKLLAAFAFILIAAPAFALTAGDVLGKMTDAERAAYITGAIEMAIGTSSPERASCITAWYFGKDGTGPKQVAAAFSAYKDKPAALLLGALMNKACGK